MISNFLNNLNYEINDYYRRKKWYYYFPLEILFIYLFIRYIKNYNSNSFFSGITLGVHEAGHLLFGYFGQFIGVAGGTIAQLAAPIICMVMLYRQKEYFGILFGGSWLAASLFDSARYIADARALVLPLVSVGGGDVVHDWNYMLYEVGLLSHDLKIAFFIRCLGYSVFILTIIVGGYFLWKIYNTKDKYSL